MSTTRIILKQDVPSLGEEGDIKVVKKGYARNYLFPKKLAVNCSKANKDMLESKKEYFEKKKLQKKENAKLLKEKLELEKISVSISAGDKGRLYGTVTTSLIVEELHKLNYSMIERKNVELKEHIKVAGNYKFRIHIYEEIYANMELQVLAKVEKKEEQEEKRPRKRRYNKSEDEAQEQAEDEKNIEENIDNSIIPTVESESKEEAQE